MPGSTEDFGIWRKAVSWDLNTERVSWDLNSERVSWDLNSEREKRFSELAEARQVGVNEMCRTFVEEIVSLSPHVEKP